LCGSSTRGRESLAFLVLFTYLLPSVVLIIPLYLMLVGLGLSNTIFSLVIAYTTFALPYALWLLRSFMAGIPEDLESAALVDGASRMGAFRDVILPQLLPGIISTALFTFILSWNEYLYALVLVNSDSARPAHHRRDEHADLVLQHRMVTADGGLGDDERAADHRLRLPAKLSDPRLRRRRGQGLIMADVVFKNVHKKFGDFIAVARSGSVDRARRIRLSARPVRLRQDNDAAHAGRTGIPHLRRDQHRRSVVNDLPPGKRDIAMVFQSYALYPHMTVAQNIAYPLKKRGVPRSEQGAMIARWPRCCN
jgi:hypothetical protein